MVPELLDGTNHVAWFRAGETIFEPSGINYLGVPGLINAHNIIATLIVQVGRDVGMHIAAVLFSQMLPPQRLVIKHWYLCCTRQAVRLWTACTLNHVHHGALHPTNMSIVKALRVMREVRTVPLTPFAVRGRRWS